MGLVLRIIGGFWILYTVRIVIGLIRQVLEAAPRFPLGIMDLVYILMLAGGVGLLLLKEWGRWLILLGCAAFLVLGVGPSLMHLHFSSQLLRPLVFYGFFVILLMLPQARSATRK